MLKELVGDETEVAVEAGPDAEPAHADRARAPTAPARRTYLTRRPDGLPDRYPRIGPPVEAALAARRAEYRAPAFESRYR